MVASPFDATHAVRFDLPRGSVRTQGDDQRVLLVPAAALDDLVRSASPEAVEALGRTLGAAIGRRAAARMGDPQEASMDAFVAQLAGEAAICGVGALSVERWGRALVIVVDDSPLVGTLLAPLVSAALEAASGRRTWCALLSRDDRVARVLVGSEQAVGRVREWIASGMTWSEALTKLHGGGA
ncbi:MAG: hypothetical protein WBY94_20180 [Polyangiaceae bacterium]